MNLSDEREAFETTAFSLTKWTVMSDQNRATRGFRLQEGQHLPEAAAARLLRGLDIDELARDDEALFSGVLPQCLLLRRNREALTFLIFARDACVQHGLTAGWLMVDRLRRAHRHSILPAGIIDVSVVQKRVVGERVSRVLRLAAGFIVALVINDWRGVGVTDAGLDD